MTVVESQIQIYSVSSPQAHASYGPTKSKKAGSWLPLQTRTNEDASISNCPTFIGPYFDNVYVNKYAPSPFTLSVLTKDSKEFPLLGN